MRPSSALTFGPGTARRGLAAAACLLALLAAVTGCKGPASPDAPSGAPASFWPCPSGQDFGVLRDGEWGCRR